MSPDPRKGRKRKLTLRAKAAMVLCAIVALAFIVVYTTQPTIQEKLSLTYLDSLSLSDLKQRPEEEYEQKAKVEDYTIYGTSLVLYDIPYAPLETDTYYGRNVMLKNIQTQETIQTSFTGGADGGIDLQTIPAGVYEVYLYDGYTPKRAYMSEEFRSDPFVTARSDKSVKSIELNAGKDYLEKFGIHSDENYLYLTVTESLPIVKIADVEIDPSGLLLQENGLEAEDYNQDGFSESEQSWALAEKVAARLEQSGLRVIFSREKDEAAGYSGADSRTAKGYDAQAKVFLSLSMSDSDQARPFLVSSPFTNGRLGNQIVHTLDAQGIELTALTQTAQLNPGNSYDLLSTDENYQYTRFSVQPALRETGGKATSAGLLEGWSANSAYSQANGMASVLFFYASTENPESRTYYSDHTDQIAAGLAQGILDYLHIEAAADSQSQSTAASSALPAEMSEAGQSTGKED